MWYTQSNNIVWLQDKLMLEPYTVHKDILYVVACANDVTVINEAKQFFNELSITYEVSEVRTETIANHMIHKS